MMISEIVNKIKNSRVKVISVDIFDTLILRHVKTPGDIFVKSYENKPEIFPDYTDGYDWKALRMDMEKKARRERHIHYDDFEVSLQDIYAYLPKYYGDAQKFIELEEKTENENCFVNPYIYITVKELHELGYRIVLNSDMYLSLSVIKSILHSCDINIELFDHIYISNEYRKSKRFYDLYEQIIDDFGISFSELFHIGDNSESDIACAKKLGIKTYHYNLISEASITYPALFLENYTPFICDGDSAALRIVSSADTSNYWRTVGTLIFGPFYTCFAQWLVSEAESQNVTRILPIMREGDFLSRLIGNAVSANQLDIHVEPLYASRMAVFSAGFNDITEKEICYLYNTHNIKLIDVFRILKIDSEIGKFERYKDKQVNQLKEETLDDDSAYSVILSWLIQPETIDYIREKNCDSSTDAIDYLRKKCSVEKTMTVDVGWRGSIQSAINKLFEENGIQHSFIHYLCISKPEVAGNLYPNTDIRGYLGNNGSEAELTRMAFARIMELSMLSTKGTTIGYQKDGCEVKPILLDVSYPEWQVDAMTELQEGVFDYQKNYYKYATKHMRNITYLKNKAPELYGIIDRMMRFPTIEEVEKLKALQYDQNFGGTGFSPILPDAFMSQIFENGIPKYYAEMYEGSIVWRSGANVLVDPLICLKMLFVVKNGFRSYAITQLIQNVVDRAEQLGKQIILVGAGRNLRTYLLILSLMNKLHIVKSIWDNAEEKQGAIYCGLEVTRPNAEDSGCYLCTVENKGVVKALYTQIRDLAGENANFIGLGYKP